MTCDCDKNIRELIEKHILFNGKCALDYELEGDEVMVWSHLGAVTGLQMLLWEFNGEVEY